MSSDPRHSEPTGDDSVEQALDNLLARAGWPSVPEESVSRLGAYWRSISPARAGRRLIGRMVPLASAAAIVIAAVFVGVLLKRGGPAPDGTKIASTASSTGTRDTTQTVLYIPSPASPYASRALTDRDRLLLQLASISTHPPGPRQSPREILVQGLLADALNGPMRGRPAAWRLRDHGRLAEEQLLEDLAVAEGSVQRLEDVRLLASIATARSLPALVTLVRDPQTRRAAMPAILRLADAPTLAMLARQTPAGDGRDLLAAMLRRDSRQAVRLLLPLIKDPAMLPAAIAALDSVASDSQVRRNLTAVLIEELQGPRVEDRLAAARALGRFNDPETAARLSEMADRNVSRREALLALIWSVPRSASASAALNAARRSARLSSTVRSLELTMSESRSSGEPRPAFSPRIFDPKHSS
jgi:hypothetical protein